MNTLKTINEDLNYLRKISKKIDKTDKNIARYISTLKDYCKGKELYGISGIQLGIDKRIIYIKQSSEYEELILINPIITYQVGNTYFWESCLSCLNNVCLVCRPYEVAITYYDEKFNNKNVVFKGFISTIISHEIDHLNGILIMDNAEEIKYLSKEERNALRTANPYRIVNRNKPYKKNGLSIDKVSKSK